MRTPRKSSLTSYLLLFSLLFPCQIRAPIVPLPDRPESTRRTTISCLVGMEHARRGANALAGGNPSLAIEHYTKAIHELPNAVDYYIQRSSAYHRLASHESALQDANKAVLLAQQRGKREFVAKAQLRRGIALFGMEKYGDAQVVLGFAKKLDEKEKTVPIWEMKVKQALDKLPTDDLRRKATVTEIPSVPTEPSVQSCTKQMHEVSAHEKQSGAEPRKSEEVESKTTSSYSQSKPSKNSARYDWYQSSGIVSMSIFASGVKEENCSVQLAERLVRWKKSSFGFER